MLSYWRSSYWRNGKRIDTWGLVYHEMWLTSAPANAWRFHFHKAR